MIQITNILRFELLHTCTSQRVRLSAFALITDKGEFQSSINLQPIFRLDFNEVFGKKVCLGSDTNFRGIAKVPAKNLIHLGEIL